MIMQGTIPLLAGAGSPPSAFDADYQAILNVATALGYALPTAGNQTAGNKLVLDLKSCGAWSRLDGLWVYMKAGDNNFALLNWKNPTGVKAIRVVSPTWSAAGYSGTSTSYIDTQIVPGASGNYALNSAHAGFYCASLAAVGTQDVVDAAGSAVRLWWRNSGPGWRFFLNDNTNIVTERVKTDGVNMISRAASNQFVHYANGTVVQTISRNAMAIPTTKLHTSKSANVVGLVYFGSNVSDLEPAYSQCYLDFANAS